MFITCKRANRLTKKRLSYLIWIIFQLLSEINLFNTNTIYVRPFFPIFLILTFWVLSVYAQQAKDSTEREPKNSFEVFINGKRYKVVEGEVLTLDTTLSKPSISIRLSDRKKFETPSLSFEYPKHLSFEYEKNPGIKTWTLTGNSLVVMLFEFEDKTPLDTLTDALVEKFGKKNCVAENFKKELGHQ